MKSIRIGFTGTHGTGKSTLLKELQKIYPDMILMDNSIRNWIIDARSKGYDYSSLWARGTEKTQIIFLMNHINEILKLDKSKSYASSRTTIDYLAYYRNMPINEERELHEWYNDFAIEQAKELYDYVFFTPIEFDLVNEALRYKENTRVSVENTIRDTLNMFDIPYTVLTGTVEERMATILETINKNEV